MEGTEWSIAATRASMPATCARGTPGPPAEEGHCGPPPAPPPPHPPPPPPLPISKRINPPREGRGARRQPKARDGEGPRPPRDAPGRPPEARGCRAPAE